MQHIENVINAKTYRVPHFAIAILLLEQCYQ